jgi:hypothetical protein
MASLLPPTSPPLTKHHFFPSFSCNNHISHLNLATTKSNKRLNSKFNAFSNDVLIDALSSFDSSPLFPFLKQEISQFEGVIAGMTESERFVAFLFSSIIWVYLTARPGVLIGAIDAYVFAPLQLGLDSFLGRRNLKMSDFVVGDKLGEGSFGIVYAGAIVPKNISAEEKLNKRGKRIKIDDRFKKKVILKKVTFIFWKSYSA